MANQLRGNDLRKIGYPEGAAINRALDVLAQKEFKKMDKGSALALLKQIKDDPFKYVRDENWRPVAEELVPQPTRDMALNPAVKDYRRYGNDCIGDGARRQMDVAMQLPITLNGALMPDAHQGSGLPIGGVLAADNAVIPYGVGMDVGCRMALSVFKRPPKCTWKNRKVPPAARGAIPRLALALPAGRAGMGGHEFGRRLRLGLPPQH
jgi:tRNA-splicing ligase RtcB